MMYFWQSADYYTPVSAECVSHMNWNHVFKTQFQNYNWNRVFQDYVYNCVQQTLKFPELNRIAVDKNASIALSLNEKHSWNTQFNQYPFFLLLHLHMHQVGIEK